MVKTIITFIRSTLFNILFYGLTALACVFCLPGLLLKDRGLYMIVHSFVNTVYFLEKYVLGLDYEVRGIEHLPESGSYVVAAKHQSPYETMKLHRLFKRPAIVLKKELLSIPLWGKFLSRVEPIAIDRSQGKSAMNQIIEGAEAIKDDGRAIVIFPQGTRVYPWQTTKDKPYRAGVARIHINTGMPIIPLSMNSGIFWPRKSWLKQPGKVIFEFHEALAPSQSVEDIMAELEKIVETHSKTLENEAIDKNATLRINQENKDTVKTA